MKYVTAFYNAISRIYGLNESLERGVMRGTFSFHANSDLEVECGRFLDERGIRQKKRKFTLRLDHDNDTQLEMLVALGDAMQSIYPNKVSIEKFKPD